MNERIEAVKILEKVNNDFGYTSELINHINNDSLNKAFIRELVYGVTENKILIDHILKLKLERQKKQIPIKLIEIFRISIYQLMFLDNIPGYAIVNEALEIANYFKLSKFKGLLNAVLRKILDNTIEEYLNTIKDRDIRLKTEFSVGDDFYKLLNEQYSRKTLVKILKSFNDKKEFIIRVNNLKTSKKEILNIFKEENIQYISHPFLENALIIINPNNIFKTNAFKNGLFTIQDGGSIFVGDVLNPSNNSEILDLCAAPGSKTCYISELMNNTGNILANDIYKNKLDKINQNILRLGCKNINTTSFDGMILQENLIDKFDYILLDVPCSGSGIVSRKPEIKLYRTINQVNDLIITQRKLFENALKYLKKGGELVYSTCSIFKEENEEQVDYFIKSHREIDKLSVLFKNKELPFVKFMPYEIGTNGFFISKFTKKY
ncbi:16S rRNA (cytosine(967)-C(5))-methyltransferase RsmB [Miniphocaeibacter massiliensis]|uniref:16S rRNA (cytosine(967)-C(5))-methyltransferase RsmB n=1 Tax=Miniphocaeibacter massiliensis TaxID=2041841 RepID=UPI000C076AE4|nr:16S rRNA (cytosine(967)-C(5))-methyltransferase RsmB [Miniphocaeibacter massiliensis]